MTVLKLDKELDGRMFLNLIRSSLATTVVCFQKKKEKKEEERKKRQSLWHPGYTGWFYTQNRMMKSLKKKITNFFLFLGELPNLRIPFHTVFKLTPIAYGEFVHDIN